MSSTAQNAQNVLRAATSRANPTALAFLAAGVLFAITSIFAPGFAAPNHLPIFALQASFVGIVALGQFTVVVAGGIDLSMPSTITASAIVLSLFVDTHSERLIWAIPLVLLMAAGVGIANGIGVAVLGASPIVITLAMNVLVQGLLIALTGGAKANAATSALASLSDGRVLHFPAPCSCGSC